MTTAEALTGVGAGPLPPPLRPDTCTRAQFVRVWVLSPMELFRSAGLVAGIRDRSGKGGRGSIPQGVLA
jgi:hypothetical protein